MKTMLFIDFEAQKWKALIKYCLERLNKGLISSVGILLGINIIPIYFLHHSLKALDVIFIKLMETCSDICILMIVTIT